MSMGTLAVQALVLMAADSGELSTPAEVDIMLHDLNGTTHKDTTWRELMDALLDRRFAASEELKQQKPVALAGAG